MTRVTRILFLAAVTLAVACTDQELLPTDPTAPTEAGSGMMAAASVANSTTGPTIATDLPDYAPGDTVRITGTGWTPGETVHLVLIEDPVVHGPREWDVVADSLGSIADSSFSPEPHHLGATFTLTAQGLTSELTAQTTFTDNHDVEMLIMPSNVPAGTNRTYTVAINLVDNLNVNNPLGSVRIQPTSDWTSVAIVAGSVRVSGGLIWNASVAAGNRIDLVAASNANRLATNGQSITVLITATTGSSSGVKAWQATARRDLNHSGTTFQVPDQKVNIGDNDRDATAVVSPSTANTGTSNVHTMTITRTGGGDRLGSVSFNLPAGFAITTVGAVTAPAGKSWTRTFDPGTGLIKLWANNDNSRLTANNQSVSIAVTATAPGAAGTHEWRTGVWKGFHFDDDPFDPGTQPTVTVAAVNTGPVVDAGGPYQGTEGTAIPLSGATASGTALPLTYAWTYAPGAGVDAGGTCIFTPSGAALNPSVTCTDDGPYSLTLTVTDNDNKTASDNATLIVTNLNPAADAGGPYAGNEGSPVSLNGSVTDAGSNDSHTWSWQYVAGAGVDAGATCSFNNASAEDPSITCTDDGTVQLTLTVTDDDGGSHNDQAMLTLANVNPVANGSGPYSGDEGSAIQLTGTRSDVGSNDALSQQWTYAGGAGVDAGATCNFSPNAASLSPTINCTDDGSYQLTLTVHDDDGGTGTSNAALTVANAAPIAEAGGPYSGNEGSPVQLNGTVTDAGSNDTHTWSWAYVAGAGLDGGTCSFNNANAQDPTITCTDDGTVELTLTVKDDDGTESAADEAALTLANVDPVANAGGPYSGNEGAAVQLNGAVTDAGSNDTHTWSWQYVAGAGLDAGATCSFSSATAEDPTITCTDDGTVQLTLTVTDDDGGSDNDQATLTLANVNPVANAGGPYSGNEGSAISLNGSTTDAGGNDSHTWSWQYVAGAGVDAGATCSFNNASAEDPTITCTDDGTVKLTLTVTDDDGGSDGDEATLTLANVNPVANAGGPYSGNEGALIQLTGIKSDAGTNDALSQQWSYTPGVGVDAGATCSFSPNNLALTPTITCTDDGAYQLTLTVSDDDGGSGANNTALTVANVNPVIASPLTKPDGSLLPTTLIVAGSLGLKATFGDAGSNDHHTAEVDCGTGYSSLGAATSPVTTSCTFATIGPKTIRVKVTDDDGGYDVETHEIVVKYNFDGFFAPVDRPNTMNVSKAGQAIPLKWRLTDANGAPVSDVVAVTIRAKDQGCATGATTDQLEEYAAGASGLQNHGDGRYQFNWKTPSTYAGSCKSIELVFGTGGLSYVDGPHAYFSFKR